jgi:hypothetical protein|tara:strand:+ start:286 stop:468 length:183 start_codon:yes stop_codon:yes gene_type:complete
MFKNGVNLGKTMIEIPESLREEVDETIQQWGEENWLYHHLDNWHFKLPDHKYPEGIITLC